MTEHQQKIYDYVKQYPNCTRKEIIENLNISKSYVYRFLELNYFKKSIIKNSSGHCNIYHVNEQNNKFNLMHHEIHRAFWGMNV